jgi:hypothetical protein
MGRLGFIPAQPIPPPEAGADRERGTAAKKGASRLEERDDWPEKVKKVEEIGARLKRGILVANACQLSGVTESSYRRWRKRVDNLKDNQ